MNRLEQDFGDQIEFVLLDIDDSSQATEDMRQQYSITGRSQYVLVDTNGEVVQRWFGLLSEDSISAELATLLAESG